MFDISRVQGGDKMAEKLLRIVDLTKFYGKKPAVESVNLNVFSGEIVGFVGPNGAGKQQQ